MRSLLVQGGELVDGLLVIVAVLLHALLVHVVEVVLALDHLPHPSDRVQALFLLLVRVAHAQVRYLQGLLLQAGTVVPPVLAGHTALPLLIGPSGYILLGRFLLLLLLDLVDPVVGEEPLLHESDSLLYVRQRLLVPAAHCRLLQVQHVAADPLVLKHPLQLLLLPQPWLGCGCVSTGLVDQQVYCSLNLIHLLGPLELLDEGLSLLELLLVGLVILPLLVYIGLILTLSICPTLPQQLPLLFLFVVDHLAEISVLAHAYLRTGGFRSMFFEVSAVS